MNTHIYKVGQVISTVISKRRVEGDVIAVSGKAVETSIGRFTKRKGGYYVLEGKGTFSVYCGEFTLTPPRAVAAVVIEETQHLTRDEKSAVEVLASTIAQARSREEVLGWLANLPDWFVYEGGRHIALHKAANDSRRVLLVKVS